MRHHNALLAPTCGALVLILGGSNLVASFMVHPFQGSSVSQSPNHLKNHRTLSALQQLSLAAKKESNDEIDNDNDNDDNLEDASAASKLSSKEELVKAVGEQMRKSQQQQRGAQKQQPSGSSDEGESSLLDRLNPFKAGQNLRKTIDTALTSINLPSERKTMYYVDDRLNDRGGGGPTITERNPLLDRLEQDDFVPEVLVVGATGEVGRLVVRRLLLEGRFRVRVLVRDL